MVEGGGQLRLLEQGLGELGHTEFGVLVTETEGSKRYKRLSESINRKREAHTTTDLA